MIDDLIGRVADAGFIFEVSAGTAQLVRIHQGANLPPDLLAEVKAHRGEIIAKLEGASDVAPEPQTCSLCERDVSDPETRERLADPAFCDRGGARAAKDRQGNVIAEAVERCPYKPRAA